MSFSPFSRGTSREKMNFPTSFFLYLIAITITITTVQCASGKNWFSKDTKCFARDVGPGERVCVCNATHCDTINPLPPFPSRMYNVYKSDKEGSRFAFARKNLAKWINPRSVKIVVNSSESYQKIIGFGGSLSDASLLNMHYLSEETRNQLVTSYFSVKGIEYNLVRIPIGGNDYSNRTYTLDEVDGDLALAYFSLSYEDVNLRIPLLLKARAASRKGVEIVAAAWTAPPWMKTNYDYKGFGLLKDEYYSSWSKYHIRFLEEYEKRGVSIWAITTGYQPSSGLLPFYPYNCMGWTPFSQMQWISENLGPDLENSKFNATKIIALDDSRLFLPWWPKMIFSNRKSKSYVNGIGVQWYWNFIIPSRLVDLTHFEFPGKFILNTEASFNKWKGSPEPVILGSWGRAEEYAESIIDDMNHWMSGWMDSNLALDLQGGPSWAENFVDAAVIVNASANEFYKQPMFYALGHFSKFIPKGSVRIDVKVSKPGIKATGFKTPEGNVVIVIVNKKNLDIPITITGSLKGNANILLTKKSIMTIIYRDKKKFSFSKVFF